MTQMTGKIPLPSIPQRRLTICCFRYFLAAEEQLKGETGKTHLTSIQARLLQCYYLLSRSRIHQSYSIFGTVVTFIHVAGLHRKHTRDEAASSLETEYRRRVF